MLGCVLLWTAAAGAQQPGPAPKKQKKSAAPAPPPGKLEQRENQPFPLTEQKGRRPATAAGGESLGWLLLRVGLYLGLVLVLLYVTAWTVRRFLPVRRQLLDHPSIQVLGRSFLSPRISLYLVQVGSRVLVLGVAGERITTLAEIDDAADVQAILAASTPQKGRGFEGLFRRAVEQYGESPVREGEAERLLERMKEKG